MNHYSLFLLLSASEPVGTVWQLDDNDLTLTFDVVPCFLCLECTLETAEMSFGWNFSAILQAVNNKDFNRKREPKHFVFWVGLYESASPASVLLNNKTRLLNVTQIAYPCRGITHGILL